MKEREIPTLQEATLGVFLHDIGKFMQRARPEMPASVRDLAEEILPSGDGRRTHWHALWTEAFFQALEGTRVPGVRLELVRNVAVYHHRASPNIPLTELAAEADRLAAGMDRKPRDEESEADAEHRGWQALAAVPLLNPLAKVDLDIGLGSPTESYIPLVELVPGEKLLPVRLPETSDGVSRYRTLWDRFLEEFKQACTLPSFELLAEAALSLSERYTFAIPSSVRDEPDISLHDHHRTAAAVAAALYRWHEREGSLCDGGRIRDRSIGKFRFLAGDLSGIQQTLFRLAAQQIKGLNKILRARSLLMAMAGEAAALAARRALGLPPFSLLQNAGGRFLLLVPALEEVEDKVNELRREIDAWMRERYFGDLALNLALSEPFNGQQLLRENFPKILEALGQAIESAKLRAFRYLALEPLQPVDYPYGPCNACGMRPAAKPEPDDRCQACQQEQELGGALPRIQAFCWRPAGTGRIEFFAGLSLDWRFECERAYPDWISAFRLYGAEEADRRLALRFLASYVPRLSEEEINKPAYSLLSEEAREVEPGDLKTFEHIALDGIEPVDGELKGEPLLAVFKADVDRLGAIFSGGVKDATLSRFAALSRMMDFFFTGYLPDLLKREFPSIYTVYAGGDDMLLIGPWRQALEMAARVRQKFGCWAGDNPNVTLSAGIELVKPQQPVGPAVARAERRLDAAKKRKNRVAAIVEEPLSWEQFEKGLHDGDRLCEYLRTELINAIFLYRVLYFAGERRRAEGRPMNLKAADWPARWGYYLARQLARLGERRQKEASELREFANHLLGLDLDLQRQYLQAPPRLAVTIALYRNRTPEKGR